MELRHLRYFIAVAETGSLSRAAEKLFIAQPPLSVQIRQLEDAMGTPLFVRHPKGVRLTAAGEALMPEARALLDRAGHLKERLRGDGASGTLALGYVPSASSTVLPALVRELRAAHPQLRIELREMISSAQTEALVAGHLDAGIARSAARHPRVVAPAQMDDPFCLASPATEPPAPPARPRAIDLHGLAEQDFVAFTRHRGPATFDQSIHLCARAGFSPRIRYEASTVHGVLDLVAAGLGHALVPQSAVLLGRTGVAFRRIRSPAQDQVLALLRRKRDARAVPQWLDQAVRAIFGQMAQRMATEL
ncbi:LysR family transcriptional regulator [Pseudorhodoferax aquiterrae]|uniref:LysR family transcriptional regulator n=1 Tax=Pseudorhodoferax aquiterrae TaxID=747304 RepID=A0ABQ3G9F7_9BURK|nr:LysR substrate-binding domain-containing protein [Pseudorhodoferax aquiterrae]GHC97376.1 LysR family transcriptional regulator [Pseudorhodoferax aquiterrae]